MSNISNYLAAALLNETLRNSNYVPPASVYVALYTSNPTAADTGTEVGGGTYARQVVTFGAPAAEGGKRTVKNAEVVFPVAGEDWGAVTYIGIRDALSAGNLLYFIALDNPRTIFSGDRFRLLLDSVSIKIS